MQNMLTLDYFMEYFYLNYNIRLYICMQWFGWVETVQMRAVENFLARFELNYYDFLYIQFVLLSLQRQCV